MADFRIRVIVDPSSATAGTMAVQSSLNRTASTADRLRRILILAFAGSTITLGISRLVRGLAEFEQALSTAQAITAANTNQFGQLREEASRLGATTRFTATQAAEGMIFLGRAGLEVNEVLQATEGTLRLAQAGALDLGRAADIATNILQSFRLEVDQLNRVVDVMALIANSSNTNISQLGDAMKLAAPLAAGFGISVEETSAAIGALSNAGLQATLAGTGLRRVISGLAAPTKAAERVFDQLGVSVDDYQLTTNTLTEALINLADAGINTTQAIEVFGLRGGPAFEVLASSIPDVINLDRRLNDAGGTAERIAQIMDDNLNGALLRMRSALEAVRNAFAFIGASNILTQTFDGLAFSFRTLARNIETVTTAAAILLVALAVPKIAAITTALYAMSAALLATGVSFNVATAAAARFAPVAIAAGIVIAIQEIRRLHRAVNETPATFGDAALVAVDRFVNAFVGGFAAIGSVITGALHIITDPIAAALEAIAQNFWRSITTFAPAGSDAQAELARRNRENFQQVGQAYSRALGRFGSQFQEALEFDSIPIASEEQRQRFARTQQQPQQPTGLAGFERFQEDQARRQRAQEVLESATEAAYSRLFISDEGLPEGREDQERALRHARALEDVYQQLVAVGLASRDVAFEGELWADRMRAAIDTTAEGAEEALANIDAILRRFQQLQGDDPLAGFRIGLETVESGIRSVAESIRDVTVGAFRSMEEALVSFVRTGEFNFGNLVDSILAELARVAIQQQLIQPLAAALGSVFSGAFNFGNALNQGTLASPSLPGGGALAAASGGLIRGPGGPTSDSIPARLSNGEFVVNAAATRRYLPTLQKINSYQNGGAVQSRRDGTQVNVYNNASGGQQVQVNQRQNGDLEEINILIEDAIDGSLSNGRFDGALGSRYGIRPGLT